MEHISLGPVPMLLIIKQKYKCHKGKHRSSIGH